MNENPLYMPDMEAARKASAYLEEFFLTGFPSFMRNASLFSDPFAYAALNPSPISKPLTAPIDITAFARFALNFSRLTINALTPHRF